MITEHERSVFLEPVNALRVSDRTMFSSKAYQHSVPTINIAYRRFTSGQDGVSLHSGTFEHILCLPLHRKQKTISHFGNPKNIVTSVYDQRHFVVHPALQPIVCEWELEDPSDIYDMLHVHVPQDLLAQIVGEADQNPKSDDAGSNYQLQTTVARQLRNLCLAEITNATAQFRIFEEALSLNAALLVARFFGLKPTLHSRKQNKLDELELSRSLEYIHCENVKNISLYNLAENVGLSTFHFARLFRETIGVPPHRYLLHLKVARAKSLMAKTNVPLSQIAIDCGFADQPHMSRHFKNLTGVTPATFRRDAR